MDGPFLKGQVGMGKQDMYSSRPEEKLKYPLPFKVVHNTSGGGTEWELSSHKVTLLLYNT